MAKLEKGIRIATSFVALGALGGSASIQPRSESVPTKPGVYTNCDTGTPQTTYVLSLQGGPFLMNIGGASVRFDSGEGTLGVEANPPKPSSTEINSQVNDGREVLTIVETARRNKPRILQG